MDSQDQVHFKDSSNCPLYKSSMETHAHFRTGSDSQDGRRWPQFHQSVSKNWDPILLKLINKAIIEWKFIISPPIPHNLPESYHILFLKQNSIGWNQILNGRLWNEWERLQDKYSSKNKNAITMNNENWATNIILNIRNASSITIQNYMIQKNHKYDKVTIRQS